MALPKPHIRLILDFDGTVTKSDTTAVIGSRCIARARELAPADVPSDRLAKSMEYYSEVYMQEYSAWKKSSTWPAENRKTIDEEVEYLSRSRRIDEESFLRVRDAILQTPGDIGEMESNETLRDEFMMESGRQAVRSGEVQIRDLDALKKLISKAGEEGNMWSIVSVSWSRRFILGTLLEAGLITEGEEESIAKKIRCNELLAPDYSSQEGRVTLCSAQDKRDALQGQLRDLNGTSHPISSRDEDATITVYVGDSTTDLGCLVGPSIGMYLSDGNKQNAVYETMSRLGIECISIDKLPVQNAPSHLIGMMEKLQHEGKPPHIVCAIQNFQELYGWISSIG